MGRQGSENKVRGPRICYSLRRERGTESMAWDGGEDSPGDSSASLTDRGDSRHPPGEMHKTFSPIPTVAGRPVAFALALAAFAWATPAPAGIVINEIYYDAEPNTSAAEF